jgi:hypothetical protein
MICSNVVITQALSGLQATGKMSGYHIIYRTLYTADYPYTPFGK